MLRNHRKSQLDGSISEELRLQVLHRDSWRCQICGSMLNLQVHHLVFRSHGGQDVVLLQR
jgi:5-methylcytosine-specific restriction endonuclease McrA